MSDWEWRARFYYGPGAKPPRHVGELAIETVHVGDSSLRFEVWAARSRSDIGRIDVEWIGRPLDEAELEHADAFVRALLPCGFADRPGYWEEWRP